MPIKPPNLDDRRFNELVAEARKLIPQYCPEWTNLSNADPGMTLVQLFAWMTELTIYRLNRVPDKTYIHFLNFIGEERKRARPGTVPLTFSTKADRPVEIPAFSRFNTRQAEDSPSLEWLSTDNLTVHNANITRVMAVKGGSSPVVREIPFSAFDGHQSALAFSHGRGTQFFEMDPVEFGPDAYTPNQYFYVAHDDFRLMNIDPESGRELGQLRIQRNEKDRLSIASLFQWEYPTEEGWRPIKTDLGEDARLGMEDRFLVTAMPGIVPSPFDLPNADAKLPEAITDAQWWIRGRFDYEKWLANRMLDDLEISWKDDRGGEERAINNWEVRARGRTIEFFLQDVPPMKGGWTIRFALVDRAVAAGKNSYMPKYRWYYRRGEAWETIPTDQVRTEGTMVIITGPLADMATDGFNLRSERIETVFLRGFCPDLEVDLTWHRPVEVDLFAGEDVRRLEQQVLGEGPWSPFQLSPVMPPTIGRKFFIGSDLFENRRQAPVLVEIEVGFEMNGELIEEPEKLYAMQLTYRAEDNWRVVWTKDKIYSKFTFADLDEDGAKRAAKRKIRLVLDPKKQLKGIDRHEISGVDSTWLRLELVKSSLTGKDENKDQHPIALKIYDVTLGVDKTLGSETYEQPMPGPKMVQLDHRDQNLRLTRVLTRATGRLNEYFPYFPFVEIAEENQALYLHFDKPLPIGERHIIDFRCRGETFLPSDLEMEWEVLEDRGRKRVGWQRLGTFPQSEEGTIRPPYDMSRSGALEFPLPDAPKVPKDGFWLRGRFKGGDDFKLTDIPPLPPITHMMLNTIPACNLHTMRTERYSGLGVPNQTIQLLRKPIFVHAGDERSVFPRPELFPDIRVRVETRKKEAEEWCLAEGNSLLSASKDDAVFTVDPVEGTLSFGNGIRGRMLPVGSNNIIVDLYCLVPGARGNVAPHEVVVADRFGDLEVTNLLPGTGGRDAESINEIIRRAPSILTSRDRAVTQMDFEIIAKEASGEVARAACNGRMDEDGKVEIVILPRKREGEAIPDPFLSAGLRDHVSRYLKRRCLINVDPVVRLTRFMPTDIEVTLRLRPNANIIQTRDEAEAWIKDFLNPYSGGIDKDGWPFGGTLFSQDFARMVTDIAEVRHVVKVQLFDMSAAGPRNPPGWEEGDGLSELILTQHDLFTVRRIRVQTEGTV